SRPGAIPTRSHPPPLSHPHHKPQTEFNESGVLPILFGRAPRSLTRTAARPARAGGLADAVPEGALLAGRVAGRREGVAQQAGGPLPHVVARPAGIAAGDEVH